MSNKARWAILGCLITTAIGVVVIVWPEHAKLIGKFVFWACVIGSGYLLLSIAWTSSEASRLAFARKPKIDWTDYNGVIVWEDDDGQPLRMDGSRDNYVSRRYSLSATSSHSLDLELELTDIEPNHGVFAGRLPIPIMVNPGGRPHDHPDGYALYHASSMFAEQVIWNNGTPIFHMNHPISGLTKELPPGTQRFRLRAKAMRRRPLLGFIPLTVIDTIEESRWIEISLGRDQFLVLKVT